MPWELLAQTAVSFKTYSSSQTEFSVNSSKRVHFQHIYVHTHFSVCVYIHTHTSFSLLKTIEKSFYEKYFPRPATQGDKFSYF